MGRSDHEIQIARPGEYVWPNEEAEERIVIPLPDFTDLRGWVSDMRYPLASWSNWVTTFLGVGAGAAVSWLLFDDRTSAEGIAVAALGASSLVLATFMGWVGWKLRDVEKSDRARVLARMTRLEETCPKIRPRSGGAN